MSGLKRKVDRNTELANRNPKMDSVPWKADTPMSFSSWSTQKLLYNQVLTRTCGLKQEIRMLYHLLFIYSASCIIIAMWLSKVRIQNSKYSPFPLTLESHVINKTCHVAVSAYLDQRWKGVAKVDLLGLHLALITYDAMWVFSVLCSECLNERAQSVVKF